MEALKKVEATALASNSTVLIPEVFEVLFKFVSSAFSAKMSVVDPRFRWGKENHVGEYMNVVVKM